jgi:hypothetical protein
MVQARKQQKEEDKDRLEIKRERKEQRSQGIIGKQPMHTHYTVPRIPRLGVSQLTKIQDGMRPK